MEQAKGRLEAGNMMVILANLVIPGSGYVLLGRSMRGLVMLFWMVILGYITYHLSSPQVSFIGRISGGIAVWAISCVEVYRIARKRQGQLTMN